MVFGRISWALVVLATGLGSLGAEVGRILF